MTYLSHFEARYATKHMNGQALAPQVLDNILKSIQLTPSSYGLQPYKVMVVQNPQIKKDLQPLCQGQAQIVEADTLLLFLGMTQISPAYISQYTDNLSVKRGIDKAKLKDFEKHLTAKLQDTLGVESGALATWVGKQVYIALGFALAACALEQVDSCAMEGFDKKAVDAYLGLSKDALECNVILALGHKDEARDYNAKLPKYRKDLAELLIWKK